MIRKISIIFNLIEILFVMFILFAASAFQFILHELPCPLCLLQRIGFMFMAYGFLLNFRFQPRPIHYSIIILSGIFTAFVAMRQIALHMVPGTGSYGDPFFGLHLYTWSFILAIGIVIITTLVLAPNAQYQPKPKLSRRYLFVTHILFILITAIVFLNLISVIFECGFGECPDNPVHYELLDRS